MTDSAVLLGLLPVLALAFYLLRRKAGFAAQRPEHYDATEPPFDLRRHLSGPIDCEGMIYGPLGRVTSRFEARMEGHWDGATGRLAEHFFYSSGTRQDREWHLKMGNDGTFTATAADVIGEAQGVVSGTTVRMTYRIRLPDEAGGHVLNVTDWLYLTEGGVILNRSEMRKFGIKVAELIATMRPSAQEELRAAE